MTGQRVAILDGSCSLYASRSPSSDSIKPHIGEFSSDSTTVGLRPIPRFQEIVTEVVKCALAAGDIRPGKVARVDTGVVCECTTVRKLARVIHTRVAENLAAAGGSKSGAASTDIS